MGDAVERIRETVELTSLFRKAFANALAPRLRIRFLPRLSVMSVYVRIYGCSRTRRIHGDTYFVISECTSQGDDSFIADFISSKVEHGECLLVGFRMPMKEWKKQTHSVALESTSECRGSLITDLIVP